jgi:hypothetical protein
MRSHLPPVPWSGAAGTPRGVTAFALVWFARTLNWLGRSARANQKLLGNERS